MNFMIEDSDSSNPETEDGTDVEPENSESGSDEDMTELLALAQLAIAETQQAPAVVVLQHDDLLGRWDDMIAASEVRIVEANVLIAASQARRAAMVREETNIQPVSCEDSYIQFVVGATPLLQLAIMALGIILLLTCHGAGMIYCGLGLLALGAQCSAIGFFSSVNRAEADVNTEHFVGAQNR
jgi:hypothetical protein